MQRSTESTKRRRGSALVPGLMVMTAMIGMTGAVMMLSLSSNNERTAGVDSQRAQQVANSGLAAILANLAAGDSNNLGSPDAPVTLGNGSYWASLVDNGDGTYTAVSSGVVGREERTAQVVFQPRGTGVYGNALFAGNSSGDPTYSLDFGGRGGQGDLIGGDVYSGGAISVTQDASILGTPRSVGSISGTSGEIGVAQPIPDIAGMNYEATAEIQVSDEFRGATYRSNSAGGSAWQLPEENPAHIFRKNPSNRTTETSGTAKDDYFLEDPYETVRSDSREDGSNAYRVTLAGVGSEPGTNSNHKVYFIDGNLWIHNKSSYSLKFHHDVSSGIQVTFVVKGNIYFSDNLFYTDDEKDGVAFIAMKDSGVADSGNIYFGDPVFGTLRRMSGFMYAENNFYDINLDASGSAKVDVNGNMTAGNQVVIQRDHGSSHTKLTVNFDDRIATGALDMPGLPKQSGQGDPGFDILAWNRIATPAHGVAMSMSRGDVDVFQDFLEEQRGSLGFSINIGGDDGVSLDAVLDDGGLSVDGGGLLDGVTLGGSGSDEAEENDEEAHSEGYGGGRSSRRSGLRSRRRR